PARASAMPGRKRWQHPLAERNDQAGLLGEGNELAGRDHAALRMGPAHQRLQAAMSAFFNSWSGLAPSVGAIAIPTLVPISHGPGSRSRRYRSWRDTVDPREPRAGDACRRR